MIIKSREIVLAALAVLLAFAVTACGANESATTDATKRENSQAAKFLAVSAQTLEGAKISLASLSTKPTVLWFWTPWCAICAGEAPTLNQAYAKYGEKVNFVGVGAQGTKQEMEEFVKITETSKILQINDFDSSVWAHFGIPLQPSLVFVGTDGYVDRKIGPTSEEDFQKRIAALLKTKA